MVLYVVPVELTVSQLEKLKEGKKVRIPRGKFALDNLPMHLNVSKKQHGKMYRNAKNSKGVEVKLSPEEIAGNGIFDIIKKGYKWAKKNVIDTEPYQKVVRPALSTAIDYIPNREVRTGLHAVGDLTKAFGVQARIKGTPEAKERMAKLRAMRKGGSFKTHGGSFKPM